MNAITKICTTEMYGRYSTLFSIPPQEIESNPGVGYTRLTLILHSTLHALQLNTSRPNNTLDNSRDTKAWIHRPFLSDPEASRLVSEVRASIGTIQTHLGAAGLLRPLKLAH